MRVRTLLFSSLLVGSSLIATRARAEDCPKIRPTDPGAPTFVYDVAAVSYATPEGNVRVWYVTTGKHAPNLTTTRTDGVPDSVATVGAVFEDAIVGYRKLGYKDAIRDGDYPTCASNGGDDRYDIYLVAFGGGDGNTASERCTTASPTVRCPGFITIERNFVAAGYPSALVGAQTVVPHEYFHMIQNAYDSKMDRFWQEGTAQWATKQLHPDLTDMERNMPAFFDQTKNPLDSPPTGGVVSGYLYGSAIWPQFLSERLGQGIVLDIFAADLAGKGTPLVSTASVLTDKKTSLGDEFQMFAVWNASTGKRASSGGYANASKYPMVPDADFAEFPDGAPAQVDAVTAGLAARYYIARDPSPRRISLTTDETRLSGMAMPLEAGKARVDQAKALPTTITGDTIVVLGGRATKKTDVAYSLIADAPAEDAGVDAGGDDTGPPQATPSDSKSGCSCNTPRTSPDRGALVGFGLAMLGVWARRRRR